MRIAELPHHNDFIVVRQREDTNTARVLYNLSGGDFAVLELNLVPHQMHNAPFKNSFA
jgi:hypothetical protein